MKLPRTRPIMGKVDVGRKLRDLRRERRLTQSDLASRVGIQQSDLCRMENGHYRVTLENLVKLLSELRVSMSEFFHEGSPSPVSEAEVHILEVFRSLTPDKQVALSRFVRFLRDESGDRGGH
jgi:transcriptional regulator with XRE-family HTH domain